MTTRSQKTKQNNEEEGLTLAEQLRQGHDDWMQIQWARTNERSPRTNRRSSTENISLTTAEQGREEYTPWMQQQGARTNDSNEVPSLLTVSRPNNQRYQWNYPNSIQEENRDENNVTAELDSDRRTTENTEDDSLTLAEQLRQGHDEWMQMQWARTNERSPRTNRHSTNQRDRLNYGNFHQQGNRLRLNASPIREHNPRTIERTANISLTPAWMQQQNARINDSNVVPPPLTENRPNNQRYRLKYPSSIREENREVSNVAAETDSDRRTTENTEGDSLTLAGQLRQGHTQWMRQQWARVNEPYEEPSPLPSRRNRITTPPTERRDLERISPSFGNVSVRIPEEDEERQNDFEISRNIGFSDEYIRRPISESINTRYIQNRIPNTGLQDTSDVVHEDTERWANDPEITRNLGFADEYIRGSTPESNDMVTREDRSDGEYSRNVASNTRSRPFTETGPDDATPRLLERIQPNANVLTEEEARGRSPEPAARREIIGAVVLDPDHARRIRNMHLHWSELQCENEQDNNSGPDNVTPLVLGANRLPERIQPNANVLTEEEARGRPPEPAARRDNIGAVVLNPDHARRIRNMHLQWPELQGENEQDNNSGPDNVTPLVLGANRLLERIQPNSNFLTEEEARGRPPESDPRRDNIGTVVLDPDHARRIRDMHLQWLELQWENEQDNNPSTYENLRMFRQNSQIRPITEPTRTQQPVVPLEPPPSYDMPPSYDEAMRSLHI